MHTETENEREVAREKEIHIEKGDRERERERDKAQHVRTDGRLVSMVGDRTQRYAVFSLAQLTQYVIQSLAPVKRYGITPTQEEIVSH